MSEFKKILLHYFEGVYDEPVASPQVPFNHSNSVFIPSPFQSSNTTIITNSNNNNNSNNSNMHEQQQASRCSQSSSDEKKKEDKSDAVLDTGVIIASVILLSAMSFIGTFMLATDGYIKYKLSGIDAYRKNIGEGKKSYKKWITLYKNRTLKTLLCKSGMFISVFGVVLRMPIVNYMSAVLFTASGCYMMWNYLTKSYEFKKEKEEFHELLAKVD